LTQIKLRVDRPAYGGIMEFVFQAIAACRDGFSPPCRQCSYRGADEAARRGIGATGAGESTGRPHDHDRRPERIRDGTAVSPFQREHSRGRRNDGFLLGQGSSGDTRKHHIESRDHR